MLAARVNGVTPGSQGNLLELDAVTAVVIGGTALAGGRARSSAPCSARSCSRRSRTA